MGKYTFLVVEDLDYEKTELELSGLDPERLGFMNSKERRETLLKAGLVPEEWDFWYVPFLDKRIFVVSRIEKIIREQENEDGQLSFFESESLAEAFDKKIVAIPMNQVAIKKEIDKLQRELKHVREEIAKISRSDNDVVLSLYNTIVKYATELGIGDSESITKKYLFTSNLKELTGAVLHKTVFAFKMAYILELEKHLNIKLPIILDSPSGKEVDQENIELMMNILKRDFKGNQIIIASIYDYSFSKVHKIELIDQLLDQMVIVDNAD